MNIKIEPDPAPRDGPWHRKIVDVVRIVNTKTGHTCKLECGHVISDLKHAGGVALCTQCRDAAETEGKPK